MAAVVEREDVVAGSVQAPGDVGVAAGVLGDAVGDHDGALDGGPAGRGPALPEDLSPGVPGETVGGAHLRIGLLCGASRPATVSADSRAQPSSSLPLPSIAAGIRQVRAADSTIARPPSSTSEGTLPSSS